MTILSRMWHEHANSSLFPYVPKDQPTMTTTAVAPPTIDASLIERVLIHGDLRQLTPQQKVSYYNAVCQSVGLNPLTQPFAYLVLNNREVLYAKREATEQLRQIHDVSIQIMAREVMGDCYIVTARATLPSGRTDENIGAVPIANVSGESRANAMMKAETKAKRRVTLAICGLGMLDETEVESIPDAVTHEPVIQMQRSPAPPEKREKPAAATVEDRGTPNVNNVNEETGEELPPGFACIDDIKEKGQWLQVMWGRDAMGGWMKLATKVPKLVNEARAAYEDKVPVRLHASSDGKYLDRVERYVAPVTFSGLKTDDEMPYTRSRMDE